jgi:DNA adenine methylase
MRTFFNYCGGKTRLVKTLLPYLPYTFNDYYEPFLGSGALFLEMAHRGKLMGKSCFLSDLDTLLMTTWRAIQEDGHKVLTLLKHFPDTRETWETGLKTLNDSPDDCPFQTAAAYIYVKGRSFGSILRRSKTRGRLNPSFNRSPSPLRFSCIEQGIPLLQDKVHLFGCTFSAMHPKRGDFVFLDPPYLGTSMNLYNTAHSVYPQIVDYCHHLTRRGVHWLMTNSDCAEIRESFQDYEVVSLGSKAAGFAQDKEGVRPRYGELLVLSPGLGEGREFLAENKGLNHYNGC